MTNSIEHLTAEQHQRLVATDHASKFLRNGGASLANNTTQAASVKDVIDLAHYITYGEPYSVAHVHEHFPSGMSLLVGGVGQSLADLLTPVFGKEADNEASEEENGPDLI